MEPTNVQTGTPKPFDPSSIDPNLVKSADPAGDLASKLAAGAIKIMTGQEQPTAPTPDPTTVTTPAPAAPAPTVATPASAAPAPAAPAPTVTPPAQTPPAAPAPSSAADLNLSDRYAKPDPNAQPEVPTLEPVPDQQDIRLPENTAENVGHAFAMARAETKKFRDLAEQYRQQVEQVKADYANYAQRETAITEKLTAAENRSRDLEEQIGKLDLERSPAFRSKFDEPIAQKQASLASDLVGCGVPQPEADQLAEQIITAKDHQSVQELVATLSPQAQGVAFIRFNEADALFAQRENALNEWRQTTAGLEQVATREGIVSDAQHRNEMSTLGLERVASVVPQNIWTDPEFVAYRDQVVEKVKAWYGQAPEDQIASAAIEGALVAPYAYQVIQQLGETIVKLRTQLDAKSRISSPPVSPFFHSQTPPPTPPAQKTETKEDPPKPWTSADVGDPVSAAMTLVGKTLGGRQ